MVDIQWLQGRNMLVVTGANGFIGSALVWDLNQAGYTDIIAVDTVTPNERSEPLKNSKYKKFIHTDELLPFLKDDSNDIQCIFHMGACSSTSEMNREYLKTNNTEYTQHLFEYCTNKNISFIYASSGAVYGDGKNGFNDTTNADSFKPLNPYGESKINFDSWVEKQSSTPPQWYGLRFFNVYGPNEYHKGEMSSVVYKAFLQINESGQLKLFKSNHPNYADGEQMRDFVYVKDITRWMIELFQKKSIASGIYNMGYGEARTWVDLAKNVFVGMNKDFKIEWIEMPDKFKNQYQYFTEADISKLKAQGLSSPQWPIEKGVLDYVTQYLMTEDPYL